MKKTIKIFNSFKEEEKSEKTFWMNLSGDEKLIILEQIRSQYWAINHGNFQRFQRIYKVIERS